MVIGTDTDQLGMGIHDFLLMFHIVSMSLSCTISNL